MTNKYLHKIVSQYCDTTVPEVIIAQTMKEVRANCALNEESIYDFMRGIKRNKVGAIELTEPEDWDLLDGEGLCTEELTSYQEEL